MTAPLSSRYDGIDALLAEVRANLDRVSPSAAFEEASSGVAVIVDTRPAAQRAVEGEIAPWLPVVHIERNVLEWRLDPRSDARLDIASYDARVLVLCQEGYSSSLAADTLRRLGLQRATDVEGGFEAWRAQGLPTLAAEDARTQD
ncbi:rhodanese-like domain-containing protein [Nocardioides ultimimeridianus]